MDVEFHSRLISSFLSYMVRNGCWGVGGGQVLEEAWIGSELWLQERREEGGERDVLFWWQLWSCTSGSADMGKLH